MVLADGERDPEMLRSGFTAWLRSQWPDAMHLRLAPLTKPAAGFSNETYFLDVTRTERGEEHTDAFVVRLPPAGAGIFPVYDLQRQSRVQRILTNSSVPVAPVVAAEDDRAWVGAPFFVMRRVDGRFLPTDPNPLAEGWLHDAAPADQARLHDGFLAALASVHTLDVRALGLGFAAPSGGPSLATHLDRWGDYLAWATDGNPPLAFADVLAWCRAHRPHSEPPPSLVWGDPGFANAVFGRTLVPVALLDWELVTIGPGEMDLGWFLAFHEMAARRAGGDLLGFPDRDTCIASYEKLVGRDVTAPGWFEVFGTLRGASIVLRMQELLRASDPENRLLSAAEYDARFDELIARAEREA